MGMGRSPCGDGNGDGDGPDAQDPQHLCEKEPLAIAEAGYFTLQDDVPVFQSTVSKHCRGILCPHLH